LIMFVKQNNMKSLKTAEHNRVTQMVAIALLI
jgi:hypothetical protein